MALRAGLPPEQVFRFGHAGRHPFLLREKARGDRHGLLWKISIWSRHVKFCRVVRDVLLKLLKKERVNYGGSIVWGFLLKTRVEL